MDVKNQDDAPATKGDVKLVRDELKLAQADLKRSLAVETVKTNARIDRVVEELRGEMHAMGSSIIKKVDGFMAQTGKVDRAQIIADWRLTELEKRVNSIEARPS